MGVRVPFLPSHLRLEFLVVPQAVNKMTNEVIMREMEIRRFMTGDFQYNVHQLAYIVMLCLWIIDFLLIGGCFSKMY
ncbi:MAG: hypothetical protein A3D31_03775 [Candidatus Fluviicola riflensis]|nr:MAG: hypothetical protein CHH17_11255 [Candidatus Fluviicola riflensis]OGS79097.1 MAG: hypothetical protein A3D31_03775 [Candidatus Fluviicola riflensis]OGS86529.1 MAG: hypothetical protein A2724_03235 [Fluviicola sp. RIFCSPHIGHO2_01_FULL_43_53]